MTSTLLQKCIDSLPSDLFAQCVAKRLSGVTEYNEPRLYRYVVYGWEWDSGVRKDFHCLEDALEFFKETYAKVHYFDADTDKYYCMHDHPGDIVCRDGIECIIQRPDEGWGLTRHDARFAYFGSIAKFLEEFPKKIEDYFKTRGNDVQTHIIPEDHHRSASYVNIARIPYASLPFVAHSTAATESDASTTNLADALPVDLIDTIVDNRTLFFAHTSTTVVDYDFERLVGCVASDALFERLRPHFQRSVLQITFSRNCRDSTKVIKPFATLDEVKAGLADFISREGKNGSYKFDMVSREYRPFNYRVYEIIY